MCDCILYTQLGQRRGSTSPQELQDMTPTEQVGAPHLVVGEGGREGGGGGGGGGGREGGGGGRRGVASYILRQRTLFLSCDLGVKWGAGQTFPPGCEVRGGADFSSRV